METSKFCVHLLNYVIKILIMLKSRIIDSVFHDLNNCFYSVDRGIKANDAARGSQNNRKQFSTL